MAHLACSTQPPYYRLGACPTEITVMSPELRALFLRLAGSAPADVVIMTPNLGLSCLSRKVGLRSRAADVRRIL